jgi:hypothetical protein
VRGALVVAAGTAALSLAGPFALRPFADVAGAAGDVGVAFVLDFGGTPANLVVGCVSVPSSDNRYDALAAFTQSHGLTAPTYAASGLLCSINGTPASGCGLTVSGGYIYWSYFTGGKHGWTYASTGAFGTVTAGDVEGWRFQDPGTGLPNDPRPRSRPHYAAICPPAKTTATKPAQSAHGGAAAGGGTAVAAAASARTQSGGPFTTARSKGGGVGSSASTTTTSSTYAPDKSASSNPSDSSASPPEVSIPPDPEVGITTATRHVNPGSGPDPMIIGGLVVAGLAIAAYARWRRRPRMP